MCVLLSLPRYRSTHTPSRGSRSLQMSGILSTCRKFNTVLSLSYDFISPSISALGPFDNTGGAVLTAHLPQCAYYIAYSGQPYNLTRILNADSTFNLEAYKSYSPLFLSATFAISYGLAFASITATIVHAVLYFRKPISLHLHRSLGEQPDIHARLMSQYPSVPVWWYA